MLTTLKYLQKNNISFVKNKTKTNKNYIIMRWKLSQNKQMEL